MSDARKESRKKHWKGSLATKEEGAQVPLAQYPKTKEDVWRNWAYLEYLRSIFYPNMGRMDRTVEKLFFRR